MPKKFALRFCHRNWAHRCRTQGNRILPRGLVLPPLKSLKALCAALVAKTTGRI